MKILCYWKGDTPLKCTRTLEHVKHHSSISSAACAGRFNLISTGQAWLHHTQRIDFPVLLHSTPSGVERGRKVKVDPWSGKEWKYPITSEKRKRKVKKAPTNPHGLKITEIRLSKQIFTYWARATPKPSRFIFFSTLNAKGGIESLSEKEKWKVAKSFGKERKEGGRKVRGRENRFAAGLNSIENSSRMPQRSSQITVPIAKDMGMAKEITISILPRSTSSWVCRSSIYWGNQPACRLAWVRIGEWFQASAAHLPQQAREETSSPIAESGFRPLRGRILWLVWVDHWKSTWMLWTTESYKSRITEQDLQVSNAVQGPQSRTRCK